MMRYVRQGQPKYTLQELRLAHITAKNKPEPAPPFKFHGHLERVQELDELCKKLKITKPDADASNESI